jgi:hypothetical protein
VPKELVADSVSHNATSVRPAAREPYVMQRDALAAASPSRVSQWQKFHTEHSADDPMRDPEWLRGYFEGQIDNLSFYSLMRAGSDGASGDRQCADSPDQASRTTRPCAS